MTGLVVLVTVVLTIAGLMVALDWAARPNVINAQMVWEARMRKIGEGE